MSFEPVTDPFGLLADPDLYVPRPATERALDELERGVLLGEAPVALFGPPGMGKTLLLRVLARRLAGSFRSAYLPYPLLAPRDLCRWALMNLDELPTDDPEAALLSAARREADQDFGVLLLIDDADALPLRTGQRLFEMVRASQGDLRIVLAAADHARAWRVFEQAGEELTVVQLSEPMTREETDAYLRAQLVRFDHFDAAAQRRFDAAAVDAIHAEAGGVPGMVQVAATAVLRGSPAPPPREAIHALADLEEEMAAPIPAPVLAPEPLAEAAPLPTREPAAPEPAAPAVVARDETPPLPFEAKQPASVAPAEAPDGAPMTVRSLRRRRAARLRGESQDPRKGRGRRRVILGAALAAGLAALVAGVVVATRPFASRLGEPAPEPRIAAVDVAAPPPERLPVAPPKRPSIVAPAPDSNPEPRPDATRVPAQPVPEPAPPVPEVGSPPPEAAPAELPAPEPGAKQAPAPETPRAPRTQAVAAESPDAAPVAEPVPVLTPPEPRPEPRPDVAAPPPVPRDAPAPPVAEAEAEAAVDLAPEAAPAELPAPKPEIAAVATRPDPLPEPKPKLEPMPGSEPEPRSEPEAEPVVEARPKPQPAPPKVAAAPAAFVPIDVEAPPGSTIEIDGRRIGEAPLSQVPVQVGRRRIVARLEDGSVMQRTVEISAERDRVVFY